MEKVLNEFKELAPWKQESWVVENYKRLFVHDSPFDEETLDLIEHIFCIHIDMIYDHEMINKIGFDETFELQNFYPAFYNKEIGSGTWVRVKTETGYNVYWAKAAPQKRMSPEQLHRQLKKVTQMPTKTIAQMEKIEKLYDEIAMANLITVFPHELKYVKIMRTRSKSEFILPYQYEVVEDISVYTAVINDKMNQGAVKYKSYFTKQDEDQIFYLQSRGIDRDTAVLMCKLQQVFFVIDTQKLFANWMQPVVEK